MQILRQRELKQAIVFVNSKLGCARLARSFERDGLRTNALHGDKSQDERLKALESENTKLKKLLANSMLEIDAMREVLKGK